MTGLEVGFGSQQEHLGEAHPQGVLPVEHGHETHLIRHITSLPGVQAGRKREHIPLNTHSLQFVIGLDGFFAAIAVRALVRDESIQPILRGNFEAPSTGSHRLGNGHFTTGRAVTDHGGIEVEVISLVVQVVDTDAFKQAFAVQGIGHMAHVSVRAILPEVIQLAVDHFFEHIGRLLIIGAILQGPGHPQIGLAQESLAIFQSNTPDRIVVEGGLSGQVTGIDGKGQVILDQLPQILRGAVRLLILGRVQFVVHDVRVAPQGDELEISPATEQVSFCDSASSGSTLIGVDIAQNHVGVIDQVIITFEGTLDLAGLGVESELSQGIHIHVVTVSGTAGEIVVRQAVLHQHNIVIPSTDIQVHGHNSRFHLFIRLIVSSIIDNSLSGNVQKLVAGRECHNGSQKAIRIYLVFIGHSH